MLWEPRSCFFLSAMLEFIRRKLIGSNFIINLAREGFFTASTFELRPRLVKAVAPAANGWAAPVAIVHANRRQP